MKRNEGIPQHTTEPMKFLTAVQGKTLAENRRLAVQEGRDEALSALHIELHLLEHFLEDHKTHLSVIN